MDPKQDKGVSTKKVVSKTGETGENGTYKKKHHHTGLKVFIILVFIFLVAPISALYICFFDSGKSTVTKDDDFQTSEMFEQAFITSLDNVENDGAFVLQIGTDSINQALYRAREDVVKSNDILKEIFTGIELVGDDETSTFTFKFDFNLKTIFQTRIYLETKLTYETIDANGYCMVFNISSIKIGRISGIEWLVSKILPKFLTDDTIQGLFETTGLSFKSDLAHNRVYYPMKSFTEDLLKKFPSEEGLFTAALKQLFDANSDTSILTFTSGGLKGWFDISKFKTNEKYVDASKQHGYPWKRNVDEVARKMIAAGVIGANYTGKDSSGNKLTLHEKLYQYLIDGGELLKSEEYAEFKKCLTTYGEEKLKTEFGIVPSIEEFPGFVFFTTDEPQKDYKGKYIVCPETDIVATMTAQATQAINDIIASIPSGEIYIPEYLISLDEDVLSGMLRSSQIVGYTYLIAGKVKDNPYQISPIVITDAYANIINNTIRFTVEMSYNNYPTVLCVETSFNESTSYDPENYTITMDITEMKYGEMDINDDFKVAIFDLLNDSFSIGNGLINFVPTEDKKSYALQINCKDILTGITGMELVEQYADTSINITGEKLEDIGAIQIKLKAKQ